MIMGWVRYWVLATWLPLQMNAGAQRSAGSWNGSLHEGLRIIFSLGLIAGCVMVIRGFLGPRRGENWIWTVLYGVAAAGAGALMLVLSCAWDL